MELHLRVSFAVGYLVSSSRTCPEFGCDDEGWEGEVNCKEKQMKKKNEEDDQEMALPEVGLEGQ